MEKHMITPRGISYKLTDHMDNEVIVVEVPSQHMTINLQTDTMTLKQMLGFIKAIFPLKYDALSVLDGVASIVMKYVEG